MLIRAWALLPTIAVVAIVVMGFIEIAKDLFLRHLFYTMEMRRWARRPSAEFELADLEFRLFVESCG